MKQISHNYRNGDIQLETVNSPQISRGGVLVRTHFSVVSVGTERTRAREGKMSYLQKARTRPDQVKKVLQTYQQQGFAATYEKVMNRLNSLTPLGYSTAGRVIAVGEGAEEFFVGQSVACAGAAQASHAEVNFVPKNLATAIPSGVCERDAAFTTIGAIALQGFRQSEMQLGETACVIGLGLVGQLLVQILKAAGVQVIGIDLDATRCRLSEQLGARIALHPDDAGLSATIDQLTQGVGVDCTFITAASKSNGPVELAVAISRDRARVVDVGKTRLELNWNDYYDKEIDFRFSRSYGPGRYDHNYELHGIDYPIGYVRWTERRNMQAFLSLLADKKVLIEPIMGTQSSFDNAEQVYEDLAADKDLGLGIVFAYEQANEKDRALPNIAPHSMTASASSQQVRLGVIGAGNYASSMLLPHLSTHPDVELGVLATKTGLSGTSGQRKFGFIQTTTDYQSLLASSDINTVLIATRHDSHARLVIESLQAGKAVFVEKPLAINLDELRKLHATIQSTGNKQLMVGFNRRFSDYVQHAASLFSHGKSPLSMSYRVHAGKMDSDSWYLDRARQGSRFIGEAGHFFDVFSYLTNARPLTVSAHCLRPESITDDDLDNIAVIVTYDDGSVANLLYLTQGGSKVPKELLEVFGAGRTARLKNFQSLELYEGKDQRRYKAKRSGKGQKEQLHAFVAAAKAAGPMPVSIQSLIDTTLVTLAAEHSLRCQQTVTLRDYWNASD